MNQGKGVTAAFGFACMAGLAAGLGASGPSANSRFIGSLNDPAIAADPIARPIVERMTFATDHAGEHAHVTPLPDGGFFATCSEVGVVFAPGTPMEYVNDVLSRIQPPATSRFEPQGSAWFTGGTAGVITYSLVPDGLSIPAAIQGEPTTNSSLFSTLDNIFDTRAQWQTLLGSAFTSWGEFSDVSYSLVSDDGAPWFSAGPLTGGVGRGDCRIAMKPIDGAGGVLAYNFFPLNGDMVIDQADNWGNSFNNFVFFRNVVAHEHGHGQGLSHVCPANGTKLMEPFLSTGFDGLQLDDIRATTFLYGDRLEPNAGPTGSAEAVSVPDTLLLKDLSLRDSSDVDVISFETSASVEIVASVSPVGTTYSGGPQTQACNTGSLIVGSELIDPILEILDADLNVVASVNAGGFGVAEQTDPINLGDPGVYHVRVSAAAAAGVSQIYDLQVNVSEGLPTCPEDLTGDGVVGAGDLSVLLSQWGSSGSSAELDGQPPVDAVDLSFLLSSWGDCPS